MTIATFGAGCFWCVESAMNQLKGVTRAVSGYMGGHTVNPTYQQVCTGTTGHVEVVQVSFDDAVISYEQLCRIFFALHNPTQLNRQGEDVGTQYRSVVFYHDEQQAEIARKLITELHEQQIFDSPVVTAVEAAGLFYPAETYHQGYFSQNPTQGYCQFVVAPKLAKFRKQFLSLLK